MKGFPSGKGIKSLEGAVEKGILVLSYERKEEKR